MLLTYIIFWFVLMFTGILNGMLRVYTYGKYMPELRAHQISIFTGIIFIGVLVWLMDKKWTIESGKQAIYIGLIWLFMTILFEFGFGHFVMKHPWSRLLHDYHIDEGRLWILVLLWTTIVPYIVYSFRQSHG